ncbi:putative histidine biosynthesis, aldolase-type TIM barrel [Rosa chinensis]|uniref:Putative histidine biosynthesis, aldolase-type TIM barrel n=1 Tax=Rosa chinensis TaxID=74649 RepID=A0A2P6QVX3_ROSCH|nr:putative histidine biosynthesis, aldolase-type TIM barrel [Rosa chinensis]
MQESVGCLSDSSQLVFQVKSGKSSFEQISRVYGNQAVVVSIDPCKVYVKNQNDVEFETIRVTNPVSGGWESQRIGAYKLTKAVEELGAGEILLDCIDYESKVRERGFDIDLVKLISDVVTIPMLASSGAGVVEHFSEVLTKANASAAFAAGIFHSKEGFIL